MLNAGVKAVPPADYANNLRRLRGRATVAGSSPRRKPATTREEKAQAAILHQFDFLNTFETLARLDAFFPEPVGPRAPAVVPEGGFPSRPPDTPDGLTGRFLDWQRASAKERARLVALEASFRNRPEAERAGRVPPKADSWPGRRR